MKIEKGHLIILVIFITLWFIDFITTLMNNKYIIYLESNPIYMAFQSLWPIAILNIVFIFLIYYVYKRKSEGYRFFAINLVLWLSIARIVAIYNAIQLYITQPALEVAAQVTPEARITHYSFVILLTMLIPFFVTQCVYWLFKLDHKIEKID